MTTTNEPCTHITTFERVLRGGEGPDEAAAQRFCADCGAYRWRYCDNTISEWRPPVPTSEWRTPIPTRAVDTTGGEVSFPIEVDVTAFHRALGQPVGGPVPATPPETRMRLRMRLIAEEFFETMAACTANAPALKRLGEIEHLMKELIEIAPINVDRLCP